MKMTTRAWSKQRFCCLDCHMTFVLKDVPGVSHEMRLMTKESLERGSMRILARRFAKNKSTIMKIIHKVTASVKDSVWIAKKFHPQWSGILVLDGKYVRTFDPLAIELKRSGPAHARRACLQARQFSDDELWRMHRSVWICGIDSATGDLPHYELAEEESKIDLVLYFKKLKEIGYPLRVLVVDGNDDFVSAAHHVFGRVFLVQRCTRHFVEGLKRKAKEANALANHHILELIAEIQNIIEAQSLFEAEQRLEELKQRRYKNSVSKLLLADFKHHAGELVTHLIHPEIHIPHTTNEIENLFRQLELRLASIGRFGHRTTAGHYLNAWALMRRFTPFTDCRGLRGKQRNKKSPLELAGCNTRGIDYLNLK